jgi:hypothetical protein
MRAVTLPAGESLTVGIDPSNVANNFSDTNVIIGARYGFLSLLAMAIIFALHAYLAKWLAPPASVGADQFPGVHSFIDALFLDKLLDRCNVLD